MSDLLWLDHYSGQTTDELIALEGRYRIDSLVLAFEQAMDQKAARVGDNKLTEEELVILAVEALEREVNNGGYQQFLLSLSREYVPIIVAALDRIGCPKVAEITQEAIEIMQRGHVSAEEIESGSFDDERALDLGECDSRYFEGPENIEGSLFEFIKKNRRKIQL